MGFLSTVVFGVIFSLGWTPCVGAFLSSALSLAAQQGHVAEGMLMLLVYSLGLGIPFILSAVLIDYLKSAFDWIKSTIVLLTRSAAVCWILIGILMATEPWGGF
ncbi:MAG: cytochrome c biogenesis CcdA family protein [Eisenbergiella sp.]